MAFPGKTEIERALKRLENIEGTLALPKDPTPLQKFRHELQQLVRSHKKKGAHKAPQNLVKFPRASDSIPN